MMLKRLLWFHHALKSRESALRKVTFHVAFELHLYSCLLYLLLGLDRTSLCALETTLLELRKSLCYKLSLGDVASKVEAVNTISL